jgi:hypothetical protein
MKTELLLSAMTPRSEELYHMSVDTLVRALIFSIALYSLFILPACTQAPNDAENTSLEIALDVNAPFGLNWASLEPTTKHAEEKCLSRLLIIKKLLSNSEFNFVLKSCISEQYNTTFLPKNKVLKPLQRGSVSTVVKGESEPVMYSYSYLHELQPTAKTRKKKRAHAAELKKTLVKLYGAPTTRGYYDQGRQVGFVVRGIGKKPCDFWLTPDVGIFLCSERVILIDGFEMSLSFIRLDNSPYGKLLRKTVFSPIGSDERASSEQAVIESPENVMSINKPVRILTKWLYQPSSLCAAKTLEPLETAWTISTDDKKKLSFIIENNNGDSLAEYVFDNYNDYLSTWSYNDREKASLYLLRLAAEQGSAAAMNEIGASLFYCHHNVQRDEESARLWIDRAIAGGDVLALKNRAHILLNKSTTESRQEAINLLKKCASLDGDICGEEFLALQTIKNLESQ